MKKNRHYDEVFKERAVKLSYEKSTMSAARELGLSYATITYWRKKETKK